MTKLLIVGCGKMGGAIVSGIIASDKDVEITIIEPADLPTEFNHLNHCRNLDDYQDSPDVILFGIKPQILPDIIGSYQRFSASALVLSIAAGKQLAFFEQHLGADYPIIRTMPNLPATIGKGVTVCIANGRVQDQHKVLAAQVFRCVGEVVWVDDESLMDAVTAVSGSGPAYIFHMIEAMEQAALKLGLSQNVAKELVQHTVLGSAQLAVNSAASATQLREQVTSPNGTTQAALDVLMANDALKILLSNTMQAACDRSKELS